MVMVELTLDFCGTGGDGDGGTRLSAWALLAW